MRSKIGKPHWIRDFLQRIIPVVLRMENSSLQSFVTRLDTYSIGIRSHSFVNYRTAMISATKMERMMMSKSPIIRKLILPMFVHTEQFKLIVKNRDAAEIELAADAYVPAEFAPALVSYIENHVLIRPETNKLVLDKEAYDGEQQLAVNYSKSTVDLMKRRRDVLKKQINAQYHSPDNDNYLKRMLQFMGKRLDITIPIPIRLLYYLKHWISSNLTGSMIGLQWNQRLYWKP